MTAIVSIADHQTRPAQTDQADQTDLLIATIAGGELDGLPTHEIHVWLSAHLRAMGLTPNEHNVQRVAAWLSDSN